MLDMISFIGIDKHTDLSEVIGLVTRTDFALAGLATKRALELEFGILYSEGRAGREPRYPTYADCLKMATHLDRHYISHSIHLCGFEAIQGFIDQTDEIQKLCSTATRVQLNFNVDKFANDDNQDAFIDRLIELSEGYNIVIQDNKSKGEFVKILKRRNIDVQNDHANNFAFLYDASGGFGKVIDKFQPASDVYYTGYAGGLNPENVVDIVKEIDKINDPQILYYIDMESGVRTQDWFDMEKAKKVADAILSIY